MINSIEIFGLRGFATHQKLLLPNPSGEPGSGLLSLVGSNNSGKTTISEAFRSFMSYDSPSFSQGRRNLSSGDAVSLKIYSSHGMIEISSINRGTSETLVSDINARNELRKDLLVLQSRRAFNPFFTKAEQTRLDYIQGSSLPAMRTSIVDYFYTRLFAAFKKRDEFNIRLFRVLGYELDWTLDSNEMGQHYLRINSQDASHGSEGVGEGIISIFFIVDALYDSKPGDCIFIDEPELSLHPSVQRRLFDLLVEESSSKQIVLTTHSPYFVNINTVLAGGSIARVVKNHQGVEIHQVIKTDNLRGLMANINNPHIFGLEAREIFFSDDNIILTEGQEDVIYYKKLQSQLEFNIGENFYGWGVGGAGNMDVISQLLKDLGYRRVVGILDGDKAPIHKMLVEKFDKFKYIILPVDDVRDKDGIPSKSPVIGLINKDRAIKPEHVDFTRSMFSEISDYFAS